MQIAPGPSEQLLGHKRHQISVIAVLLWLWLHQVASVWFLAIVRPYFANDFLWPEYNSTGYQTFLIDSINALLNLPTNATLVDLAMEQTYSASMTLAKTHTAYPMTLLTTKLITLEYAIVSLRNTTSELITSLPIQYCWLDFNQTWQLAHTTRRQERCVQNYKNNGAVYLESILRNTNWNELLNTTERWYEALFYDIQTYPIGKHWILTTSTVNTTIYDEATYWKSYNITKFQLQWQTASLPGIDQSIDISNAIGVVFPVLIKSTIPRPGFGGDIPSALSSRLSSDMVQVVDECNASLIVNGPNYFLGKQCATFNATSFELFFNTEWQKSEIALLLHNSLGPFLSSDLYVLPLPSALTDLVIPLRSNFYSLLLAAPELTANYTLLPSIATTPTPPTWKGDFVYYGGNPICFFSPAQSFVQTSIAFDDACKQALPLIVTFTPLTMVLALFLTPNTTTIEIICEAQSSQWCLPTLQKARSLTKSLPNLSSFIALAKEKIHQLDVSIMQFASDSTYTNYTILTQSLLDGDSPWTFYGWIMLLDWVQGAREVISIEGDNGTFVLISEAYSATTMALNKGLLTNASIIVYGVLMYFTVVMLALGAISTLASYRCQYENLQFFYRIVGSTWIGRPLMFLRGATAIVVLGSAPIRLQYNNVITRFDLASRSLLESAILSSEATWISVVAHELLVPFSTHGARAVGGISTCIAWLLCFLLDIIVPIEITTNLDLQCTAVDMITQLYCSAGVVEIGSYQRVILLLLVQVVGVLFFALSHSLLATQPDRHLESKLLSGSGQAFLLPPLDRLGSILDGILPWIHANEFDVKLWTMLQSQSPRHSSLQKAPKSALIPKSQRLGKVMVALGTAYIAIAISSSITYLQLIRVNIPNDLIWRRFNTSGVHVFISNVLLEAWPFYSSSKCVAQDDSIVNHPGMYNMTNPIIDFNGHIGAQMQYTELTSLSAAIVALRKFDACEAPWLFTQYCYLDFNKNWAMANSAKRQERCMNMTSNAAVFVEATLRNIDWDAFAHCWGDAFEIGFGHELRQSTSGINFLQSLRSMESVVNELRYWKLFNISSYTLQWQNYKYIGMINTYTITNAYGMKYPFTISATKGAYRWNDQSSLKMYWAFGNDLKSIVDNSTAIGGKSLLRSSADFAFRNVSLYSVYLQSSSLIASPTNAIYTAEQLALGPFGSVDMMYVGVPRGVQQVAQSFLQFVQRVRRLEPSLYLNITTFEYRSPVLATWFSSNFYSVRGSILCPIPPKTFSLATLKSSLSFGFDTVCEPLPSSTEHISISKSNNILFATIFAHLNVSSDVVEVCSDVLVISGNCQPALNSSLALLQSYPAQELYTNWTTQLYNTVQSLNIEWMVFGRTTPRAPITIYHRPILSIDDKYDFLAWYALYEWIIGIREVVQFQGDHGTLTLLGNEMEIYSQPVDLSQMPIVFALFAQRVVQYVTYVMIGIACLTCVYIILSRGYVEGFNMFELSRVGGIAWVGRPLIFVRSLTALSILSTAGIDLATYNGISYFSKVWEPWYTTCLEANEVTWLVGVVNDILIVITKEWTLKYATVNSILIWIISACLATLLPVDPTLTIDPQCNIDTLDYQIVCNLGDIAIGSSYRLLLLCITVIICNCLCFFMTRSLWKKTQNVASSSLLLCGSARYLFEQKSWTFGDIYYLDRASAVLNGILSYRYRNTWYIFDIKTWRVSILEAPTTDLYSNELFKYCLPLDS